MIGFVNADNIGAYGLEASYDSVLSGTTGLTVTPRTTITSPCGSGGEQMFDAENGGNLALT